MTGIANDAQEEAKSVGATIKERAFDYVRRNPGKTGYQVAVAIGKSWGSVSSRLYEMMRAGQLTREAGLGPRGGYGYFVVTGASR